MNGSPGGPGGPGGPPSSSPAICAACGAPDDGERVHCRYCKAPYNAEALRTAIPCPSCRTACRWGKQKCADCQAWIVVTCVFCGSLSPHNVSNCLRCHEAFAGAPQRKAALDQQRAQQQNLQAVNAWGGVAAAFVGAAAGSAFTHQRHVSHSYHSHHHSYSHASYDSNDDSPRESSSFFGSFFSSDGAGSSGDSDYDGGGLCDSDDSGGSWDD